MSPYEPELAAPGWYPVDHLSQRYWDGYAWTDHISPLAPANTATSSDDRTYSVLLHLSGIFVGFLAPLIMWVIRKDDSPFIDFHGRQALNFHFSMLIYVVVSLILLLVVVGFFLLIGLMVAYWVFPIIAATKANNGEYYRYPLTIRFFS